MDIKVNNITLKKVAIPIYVTINKEVAKKNIWIRPLLKRGKPIQVIGAMQHPNINGAILLAIAPEDAPSMAQLIRKRYVRFNSAEMSAYLTSMVAQPQY